MRYVDLNVYKRAYQLALHVHRLTRKFPIFEQSEMARQLRRSSESIVSNLVEGTSRMALSGREQKRFLTMAIGSNDETKLWVDMSRSLGYIADPEHQFLTDELDQIGKMLFGLWRRHN